MRHEAKCFVLAAGVMLMVANAAGQQFQLMEASINEIHRGLRSGNLTCHSLVQQYLDRIKAYEQQGPTLNAMLYVNPKVLEQADAMDKQLNRGRAALSTPEAPAGDDRRNESGGAQWHPGLTRGIFGHYGSGKVFYADGERADGGAGRDRIPRSAVSRAAVVADHLRVRAGDARTQTTAIDTAPIMSVELRK